MSDSPYKSPQSDMTDSGVPDQQREKLIRVARYQRWVIYALLANIVLNITIMSLARQGVMVQVLGLAVALGVVAFAILSIFLLQKEVSNVGVAILCAILMFIPCISLITLLVVNQGATKYLQSRGVKVGFMGADPNSI